jgi:hypothetical protein
VYHSEDSVEAYKVAEEWNKGLNNPQCIYYTEANLTAEVYEVEEEIEDVKEMKKYTIENYEEFSREALDVPPMEEFEDGTINEDKWYEENKIIITKGNHQIELDYCADNVSAIDCALKEMYEVEMDIRSATTANTVGSEYRPAELKDILRVAIQHTYGWKLSDPGEFIRDFIANTKDINDVMSYYKIIQDDYKDATNRCKCDFKTLDMSTMRISPKTIRDAIDNLIGTDIELLYGVTDDNKSSDIVFVMDYTLKLSGELIGWFYGEPNDEYIKELIADYKKKLFGEEK